MRAAVIVGPRGVERVVSVGTGPRATEASLRLMDVIWPDVQAFHRAILARVPDSVDEDEAKADEVLVTDT